MVARTFATLTPEEYLAREKAALTKSEYIAGEILPRPDGSPAHNRLTLDALFAIYSRCRTVGVDGVFGSDQRLRCADDGHFFYPDLSIAFDKPLFDADDCMLNSALVVEVFSKFTAKFDWDEKFSYYRCFPTLRHYLLVDENQLYVAHYRQKHGFVWALAGEYTGRDDSLTLPELDVRVPLAEIYRRINFS